MMDTRPRAVGDYLRQLERGLRDLPPERRDEIVSEIEEHIAGLLAEAGPSPSDADVLNILERVGDPAVIAADARDRLGVERPKPRWTDTAAVILLPIPFVGWVIGAALLWLSTVWITRDKVLGTLAGPGLFLVLGLGVTSAGADGSEELVPPDAPIETHFEPAGGDGPAVGTVELVVFGLVLLVPLAAAIHLGRKLAAARRDHPTPSEAPAH